VATTIVKRVRKNRACLGNDFVVLVTKGDDDGLKTPAMSTFVFSGPAVLYEVPSKVDILVPFYTDEHEI
jgi:hypothetical protein